LTGWGECSAGERPFFSAESTDTAWAVITQELGPTLAAASPEHGGDCPRLFKRVRGNPMARATLENAIWDIEAQREGVSLSRLLGGVRETIPCGVSLGIQASIPELLEVVERELEAGYQRIKLKCKPGWDTEVFEKVRSRWPGIMLSCDANSAYRLGDADHLVEFDAFDLLMIEQPLWHDDFYYHSMLQKRLTTAICLDESIRNRRDALAAIEMESCRIINVKLGRVGGFSEAIAVHNAAQERGIPVWCGGMLEAGIGRAHNIALSTLENFTLPGDVSASARYWKEDIVEPEITVSKAGEITIPDTPGRGYEVRTDLVERLTVRKETIRALELVG
jgi:O-succinylbenzoate synthase